MEKSSDLLVSSLADIKELKKSRKILIADFYTSEIYNPKGREFAKLLKKSFVNQKYSVLTLPSKYNEDMIKTGGLTNYTQAIAYGREISSSYVCYGNIEKQDDNNYKIILKMLDVNDENIVTIKEAFVSVN